MILLEGCDLCGKTTLARALRKSLPGWAYHACTRPPLKCGFSAYQYYTWFIANTHARVVLDRFHLSNVYQQIYTPEHVVTDMQWKVLELALLKLKTRVIYLWDTEDRILSRWRPDEMYDKESVPKLLNGYEHYLARSELPIMRVNLEEWMKVLGVNTPENIRLDDLMLNMFKDDAYRSECLPSPSIGIGTTGGILYIAEDVNDAHFSKTYTGQLPLSMGPASEFFWKALEQAEIPWQYGYYTNARDIVHWHALDNWVKPQVVVCLGKIAEKSVEEHGAYFRNRGVPIMTVKHPQSAKRFGGSSALIDYAGDLANAVDKKMIYVDMIWGRGNQGREWKG